MGQTQNPKLETREPCNAPASRARFAKFNPRCIPNVYTMRPPRFQQSPFGLPPAQKGTESGHLGQPEHRAPGSKKGLSGGHTCAKGQVSRMNKPILLTRRGVPSKNEGFPTRRGQSLVINELFIHLGLPIQLLGNSFRDPIIVSQLLAIRQLTEEK